MMPNPPPLYAPVMESWSKIREDGKITLPEWWQFSTVVFSCAVSYAAQLAGKTGPEKLDEAARMAAEVLLYVAPSLAGKIVGGVLYVVSWIGWSWPLVRAFFNAIYAGTIKGGVQVAYEKQALEKQLAVARAALGEATGGLDI